MILVTSTAVAGTAVPGWRTAIWHWDAVDVVSHVPMVRLPLLLVSGVRSVRHVNVDVHVPSVPDGAGAVAVDAVAFRTLLFGVLVDVLLQFVDQTCNLN